MLVDIIRINPVELRVIDAVLLRRVLEAAGTGGGLLQAGGAIGLGDGHGPVQKLPELHGLQLHPKDGQELRVQGPPEAEALGGVAHGGHAQGLHLVLHPGGGQGADQPVHGDGVVRGPVDVDEGPVPEGAQGVGGGVGPGQGVQPQPPPVDDGLRQGPEDHRAVEPPQHLGHIGRVGEGHVLKDDQIRLQRLQKRPQGVHGEERLLRADKVRIKARQQLLRRLESRLGAGHVERRNTDGDVNRGKGFHGWISFCCRCLDRSNRDLSNCRGGHTNPDSQCSSPSIIPCRAVVVNEKARFFSLTTAPIGGKLVAVKQDGR